MTDAFHGQRLLVRTGVVVLATPLLAVLVLVEVTDLVFAVDSIPAIFAVADEALLVFTANAFALLGLRALYFLLADLIHRFVHLKTGLALEMLWVGVKMLLKIDLDAIPTVVSLGVIATILTSAVVASLLATRGQARRTPPAPAEPPFRLATVEETARLEPLLPPPVQGPTVSRSTVTHERTGGASPLARRDRAATAGFPHLTGQHVPPEDSVSVDCLAVRDETPPGEHVLRPSRERERDGHARETEVAEPPPEQGPGDLGAAAPVLGTEHQREVGHAVLRLEASPPREHAVDEHRPGAVPVRLPARVLLLDPPSRRVLREGLRGARCAVR